MRVTNRMTMDMIQRNISLTAEKMGDLQTKMSTRKRVNVASDDPSAVHTALSIRSTMAENKQYLRNIESAKIWMNATDASLQRLEDTLIEAKSLAVRAANGTWSEEQMASMSKQADELLKQAIQVGNSTLGEDYIFSGFKVKNEPFIYVAESIDPGPPPVSTPASVLYNGDDGGIERDIGRGSTVVVNVPGDRLESVVFDVLIELRDKLVAGENTSLPLTDLDKALSAISSAHGEIGARMSRLGDAEERYGSVQANLAAVLSKNEDLDYAEAVLDLTAQETAYKAAMAAAARLSQISLLDYLR
jgi:flagellar hook-associated protein 3 FlgL